ncbi:MAG: CBS domain-containing protein [Nitrososphaerota archaeon]|nr:CBS domain-containing protein [Candidatus Geocrenenecus dongiae]
MSHEIPLIRDYMRYEIYFVDEDDPVSKCVGIFRETGLPIVVVLDKRGRYLGVVVDRVVIRSTVNLESLKTRNAAIKAPIVKTSDTISKAARYMLENVVKGLPVSNEEGKLIGTISVEDVGRVIAEKLKMNMKVKDVMTRDPITITTDTTIGKALVLMRENGISRLPVIKDNKLVGIVTIRDILEKVVQPRTRATLGEVVGERIKSLSYPVSNIMTRKVVEASPEDTLENAVKKMIDNDISCLIVTHNRRVIGIITWTDILEVIASLEEREKVPVNIQVSFKISNISEQEKNEIMNVAESFVKKFREFIGNGYLLLHFKEHKEKHGEERLIHCRAKLTTDRVNFTSIGEAWTPSLAAKSALDRIERQMLTMKELTERYPYVEEVFKRLLGEL